ncbi:FtsK/SpoIIIE domain-containing protein [Olsenella uli]|uniref:FtsK/SpoIIIE domain-containing protein n=1 Tax=Olsenella uli TaxID=133926 RepID=UPI0004499A11|nr:FtsK/SpoIIIE domain-containing protein [Olsenella uli]EUB31132.1 putative type VII secretion protein EssC [Olsenella uli MSTE5]
MTSSLLITVVIDGNAYVTTVGTLSRGIRHLTDGTGEGRSHAVASVSCGEEGVFLRPMGGASLADETGEELERATLTGTGTQAFTLEGGRAAGGASVFVRSATVGLADYRKLALVRDGSVVIGRDASCELAYDTRWVSARHAELKLEGESLSVCDLGSANGTFVNGRALTPHVPAALAPGDVVQVMDLTILAGKRVLLMNAPRGLAERLGEAAVPIDHDELVARAPEATPDDQLPDAHPFWPAPRLMRTVHRKAYNVEEPPRAKEPDDTPAIVKMGPSFLMAMSSIFMGANAVSRIAGGADALSTAPSIAMCVSMMGGMMIWPQITRRYERRKAARDEERRRSAYSDYLASLEMEFRRERDEQASILAENRVSAAECLRRAEALDPRLMSRSPLEADFMQLRVGTGTLPLEADFRWPERRFTMDKDDLLDLARSLSERPPVLEGAPIALDLMSSWVTGLVGERGRRWGLVRALVAQVATLYGFHDVKVAAVVGQDEREEWEFLFALPHALADGGHTRLIASDEASMRELSGYLARELGSRSGDAAKRQVADYGTYYLVLCANRELVDPSDALARLMDLQGNRGFSLLFMADAVDELPRECLRVLELGSGEGEGSRLYDRADVAGSEQPFEADPPVAAVGMARLASRLSRLDLGGDEAAFELPASLGFLETFRAGSVADLDVEGLWAQADSSRSLAAPIGLDSRGALAVLDPQEAFDGPHGLVAGTTGSGKSELLVTWILSTAMHFPPEQAAFVLIDYKGGGLADAFSREGLRLPHLAGTVTNLDGAEVARSLASLRAELVRRQALLAGAKRTTGDATMDVSSYQRHFAAGELSEPMPHLFVVADEFAELKAQEPEFMDGLVSAARIGRSLGVHLVLATQKPTGVVSDQIQANSRFRVCLRVADAADSREVIRRPDAAALEGPGRFLLLVGYDERYVLGQAAWAGAPCAPGGGAAPSRDLSVELCDACGAQLASARPGARGPAAGTELDAVLAEVCRAAGGRASRRLWLPPLEAHPTVAALRARYPDARAGHAPWELDPVVGELDDPARQGKRPLTLPLSREGNAVVYGAVGSGKSAIAASVLYGIVTEKGPGDVVAYAIDMGSGSLLSFDGAPQVAGVATQGDPARAQDILKVLAREVGDRRAAFEGRAGSVSSFNAIPGEGRLPTVLVVLNNVAAIVESVPGAEEALAVLMRDGPRYGIVFLLLAGSPREVRFRIASSCPQELALELADASDYTTVLGSMRGIAVPHGLGRGLVGTPDGPLHFQAAFPDRDGENPMEVARDASIAASARWGGRRAARVPELPAVMRAEDCEGFQEADGLCLGVHLDDFRPLTLRSGAGQAMLVAAAQGFNVLPFLRESARCARRVGMRVGLLDPSGLLQDAPGWVDRLGAGDVVGYAAAGADCMVLVPDARGSLLGPAFPPAARDVLSGGGAGSRATTLLGAAASDLAKLVAVPWGQRLLLRGRWAWIGEGIGTQYSVRISNSLAELKTPLEEGDGWVVWKGRARMARFPVSPDSD